jgi:hypothetical protein
MYIIQASGHIKLFNAKEGLVSCVYNLKRKRNFKEDSGRTASTLEPWDDGVLALPLGIL